MAKMIDKRSSAPDDVRVEKEPKEVPPTTVDKGSFPVWAGALADAHGAMIDVHKALFKTACGIEKPFYRGKLKEIARLLGAAITASNALGEHVVEKAAGNKERLRRVK